VSNSPSIQLVIPCAGAGSRAGAALPKQYALLGDKPVIVHTLEAMLDVKAIQKICLVISPEDSYIEDILKTYGLVRHEHLHLLYQGGQTRAQSVLAGLEFLKKEACYGSDWVLVHDAARCLITPALVEKLIASCLKDSVGGLLACPLADTLKEGEDARVRATLSREHKWLAQTPQMFRLDTLTHALLTGLRSEADVVTDEASAIERMGLKPMLVEGSPLNFKITYPLDFELAEAVLIARKR
jgi:2-C-methyl-D-erythritol 4-phosphate cytidylyltransferase